MLLLQLLLVLMLVEAVAVVAVAVVEAEAARGGGVQEEVGTVWRNLLLLVVVPAGGRREPDELPVDSFGGRLSSATSVEAARKGILGAFTDLGAQVVHPALPGTDSMKLCSSCAGKVYEFI